MFKTELHCHSKGISLCAAVDEHEIVEKYTAAGYSTLVLTNHFCEYTYNKWVKEGEGWTDFIKRYVGEYEKVKAAALGKFTVLMGAEFRFAETGANDYLCFGFDENFLLENPYVFRKSVSEFHKICQEKGYLFIQAHPFRNQMQVVKPVFLDGVEVFNGHIGHDSRNDIANAWAEKFSLIKTSGTDFHYKDAPANGGILTDEKIESSKQLVNVLKSGEYQLLKTQL